MKIHFERDDADLARLGDSWNDLLRHSVSDVPFLRHEYLRSWWATRGGGEWEHASLCIAVGTVATGETEAIAPLFQVRNPEGLPVLLLLGSFEISDYLDLIVAPDAVGDFAEALLESLGREGPEDWQVLDLYNLPETSPTPAALEAAARRRGWAVERQPLQPCPVIVLPGDWETYLASLDKKQRHELRRKVRRVEGLPGGSKWWIAGQDDDPLAAAEQMMGLMATDPAKSRFLTPLMRQQFRETVRAAHSQGWLQIAFLEIEGMPAAGYINFDYGGRIWVYNSGLNPLFISHSPGWVLLAYLIQWAIEHGRKEFDFLRGDEEYKFRLGGVGRSICRLTIRRPVKPA